MTYKEELKIEALELVNGGTTDKKRKRRAQSSYKLIQLTTNHPVLMETEQPGCGVDQEPAIEPVHAGCMVC